MSEAVTIKPKAEKTALKYIPHAGFAIDNCREEILAFDCMFAGEVALRSVRWSRFPRFADLNSIVRIEIVGPSAGE